VKRSILITLDYTHFALFLWSFMYNRPLFEFIFMHRVINPKLLIFSCSKMTSLFDSFKLSN